MLLCLGGSFTGYSQTVVFNTDQSIPVFRYTDYLINSWTGGFNAPQFSTMDLNGDSADDLVIFDRTSNRLYTFEASTMAGNPVYRHIPKYESMFPALESWVLLVDYDGDGRKDIFAHANLGVMVYRNITTSDTLKWQLMADPLYQQYSNNPAPNNIYVNITDIPAITDIDYDGDYDILNYNFFNGANIEFHKNLSVETYGHNDSLNFKAIDDCYGGIIETSCNYSFGGSCPVTRMGQITHVGAASLLIIDENGDGDKDIFSGKEDCVDLFELPNTGSAGSPAFSSVHTYPQNTSAIRFPGMPGLYFEDLDFDGIKDILASPSMFTNSALGVNDTIDFQHSC
ncbi:MAG: FG-GAP repeat domain-containing protein, partial [Cytophagaceae bacterium]